MGVCSATAKPGKLMSLPHLQVRHLQCLRIFDGTRNLTGRDGRVDLGLQGAVRARRRNNVEQGRPDGRCRRVGAGDDLEEGFGFALALGEAVPDERALVCLSACYPRRCMCDNVEWVIERRTSMSFFSFAFVPNRSLTIAWAILDARTSSSAQIFPWDYRSIRKRRTA
ncbi:hypothetical protein VTK26DRAFT_3801 [Humicola hyalothermophila]